MGTEQQLKRWSEHFNDLLNRKIPQNPPDILPAEADLLINCGQPTRQELKKAIRQMKSGKAAGPGGIPAKAMKADIDTSVEMLYPLCGKIWEEEEMSEDWKDLGNKAEFVLGPN